jgi:glutaredoxin-related protein
MKYIKTYEQFVNESHNIEFKNGDKFKVIKDLKQQHLLGFTAKHVGMINDTLPAGDIWEITGFGVVADKHPAIELRVIDTENPKLYISKEFVFGKDILTKMINSKILKEI